jgi:hypothetical protein
MATDNAHERVPKMNELVLANRAEDWRRLKMLVLDSVSSPITKRVLQSRARRILRVVRPGASARIYQATVSAWRVALEARGLGSISINVRITALRKLAVETADNGLLARELAAGTKQDLIHAPNDGISYE